MDNGQCEPKTQKHLAVDNALAELSYVLENLENILCKIRTGDIPPIDKAKLNSDKPKQISLVEFLDDAPARIQKYNERLYAVKDGLNETLF